MIRNCIICFFFIVTTSYSQGKFPKDTIANFSLTYNSSGGGRGNSYEVKIDSKGNILATLECMGGIVVGKKQIKLDKNTFRQFKNIIITEADFYSLTDTLKHKCRDCSFERLEIKTNRGIKILQGYNLNDISDKAELLFDTLDEIVGFIGTEADIE